MVAARLLELPQTVSVIRCDHGANARLMVWRTKPDLVWVFSEDMWEDKTHRWLDVAADHQIPGVWHHPQGQQKWGW